MMTHTVSPSRPWWLRFVPIAAGNLAGAVAGKLAARLEEFQHRTTRCSDCGALLHYEEPIETPATACGRRALERRRKDAERGRP